MGSSKKHKDRERERDHKRKRKHRSRSRSRSKSKERDRKHRSREEKSKRPRRDDSRRSRSQEREDHTESFAREADNVVVKRERTDDGAGPSGGGEKLELSIDESNRLRAKLGLKPLNVGSQVKEENEDGPKDILDVEDTHAPAKNLAAEKKTEDLRKKMMLIKDKRQINKKLGKVKTLGESDDEEEGAVAWVTQNRKIQTEKEAAAKRAKMLEEMDEEFGIGKIVEEEFGTKKPKGYSSRDLKGITVAHNQDSFKEGRSIILTLKDKGILDEDQDDTLENVNLIDDEKYKKNVDNKKKKPDYVAYEEFDEDGVYKPKDILEKYNEEIDGEKRAQFELGSGGKYDTTHERRMDDIRDEMKKQQETLILPALRLASEYYSTSDMEGFKKSKRRAKKIRKKPKAIRATDLEPLAEDTGDLGSRNRRRGEGEETEVPHIKEEDATVIPGLDLAQDEDMDVDEKDILDESEILGPEEDLTGVAIEDEAGQELQSVLNKAIKVKQKMKKKPQHVEDIVAARVKDEDMADSSSRPAKGEAISLNATSEFCRALGEIPTYGQAGNRDDEDEEELLEWEMELQEKRRKEMAEREEDDEAEPITGWMSVEIDTRPVDIAEEDKGVLDDEPVLNSGIGAALELANKKGYLESEVKKMASAPMHHSLLAKNYSIEDKRYEDLDEKYRKRDRYSGGITMDFKEKESYKPDVNLDYVDETGRLMNQKEAFRYLSHRFHGKGSGKRKTEKRQKKLEEEQLMKTMSSTDTPLGTVNLLQEKQKAEKTPYIVLSGAGKGLASTNLTK